MVASSTINKKTYCSCLFWSLPGALTLGGLSASATSWLVMTTSMPSVSHKKTNGNSARLVKAVMRAISPGPAAASLGSEPSAACSTPAPKETLLPCLLPPLERGEEGGDAPAAPRSAELPDSGAPRLGPPGREAAALTSSSSMLPPRNRRIATWMPT